MTETARIADYPEVWLVHFEADRPPGEPPRPTALDARERRSGRRVRLGPAELARGAPPCPFGPGALFACHGASEALGCHLALGWPLPKNVLDLRAELLCQTGDVRSLVDLTAEESAGHLGLSAGPDGPLGALLAGLEGTLDLPRALVRGLYGGAAAVVEAHGVPVDGEALALLRGGWDEVRGTLVAAVDRDYGVYEGLRIHAGRWSAWARDNGVPWPKGPSVQLDMRLKAFKEVARSYPKVRPVKELQATLAQMRRCPLGLPVGADGRHRVPLRPFASTTGRNQPRGGFVFGAPSWMRGLVRPAPGMALAYVDYVQQELGIAAALSGDAAMMAAYESGDFYLKFGELANVVPAGATKWSHPEERERLKACALGVQYGCTACGLARRLGVSLGEGKRLLDHHRAAFPDYRWWSGEVERRGREDGELTAAFGWRLAVTPEVKKRSLRNWPLQANGAEMLRLACVLALQGGVKVCALVHDAILVEAPEGQIGRAVELTKGAMERASRLVLGGYKLRVEDVVVRHPERMLGEKGRPMWERVFRLLGGPERTARRLERTASATPPKSSLGCPWETQEVEGVDWALAGLRVGQVVAGPPPARPAVSSRPSQFLAGPVPLSWLTRACQLPQKSLAAALSACFLAGLFRRHDRLDLNKETRGRFGLDSRASKDRALGSLAAAGLIKVEPQGAGRPALVTVLGAPGLGGVGALAESKFFKGPIPLDWLAAACALPGEKTLAVGLASWFLRGVSKGRGRAKLGRSALRHFGVDVRRQRKAVDAALRALEGAGLIKVERRRGRSPRVTVLTGGGRVGRRA